MSTAKSKKQEACLSCMECCKTLAFNLPRKALDKPTKEFYTTRGAKFTYQGNIVWVMVPSVCPNLTSFGCKDYEDRPYVCRIYDGRNFPFMDDICKWNNM